MASWELQTTIGEPLAVAGGRVTVTPQAQRLVLRWRSMSFVWNRPVAVLVEQGGQVKRYPIRDVTRLVQLGLGSATLLIVAAGLIASWWKKGAVRPQRPQQAPGAAGAVPAGRPWRKKGAAQSWRAWRRPI